LTPSLESRTLRNSVKPRPFNHVVGVDLGGGKGKKTALATLRVDAIGATVVEIAPREGERPFFGTMTRSGRCRRDSFLPQLIPGWAGKGQCVAREWRIVWCERRQPSRQRLWRRSSE